MQFIAIFVLALLALPAFAKRASCNVILNGVEVTPPAVENITSLKLSEDLVENIITDAVKVYEAKENCEPEFVMVFRRQWTPNYTPDAGFLVRFKPGRNYELAVKSISHTHYVEEREYFDRWSECAELQTFSAKLPHVVLGANRMEILPDALVKLREKHRVSIAEIREAFSNPLGPLEQSFRKNWRHREPRFVFEGVTNAGRRLKVVVGLYQNRKTFRVISAYVPTF